MQYLESIRNFCKKEIVLCIAGLAAIVSAFFVSSEVNSVDQYLGYIDFRVLGLLLALMAVVAGFSEVGIFKLLANELLVRCKTVRGLSFILVGICFFMSMFVTNDVALITMVPFTLLVLESQSERRNIFVICMETVSANMGSMLTPIGNPQNLYIFTHYDVPLGQFIKITAPIAAFCLVFLYVVIALVHNRDMGEADHGAYSNISSRIECVVYSALFVLCILAVLKIVDYRLVVAIVCAAILLVNKEVMLRVDYCLLLTFVAFFIFVGNLQSIPAVSAWISGLLEGAAGWTMLMAALFSQVISNVPCAVMLSGFTDNFEELLLGVDIGGMGTLVASLASLISFKLYSQSKGANKVKYLLRFSQVNFVMLAATLGFAYLWFYVFRL